MSEHPTNIGPCAAYAEDVQEETQTTIPGTKQSASVVRPKKSKRDAASDSGYSSRTAATNGSQSTSGSSKLLSFVGRMTGNTKKSSKEAAESPALKTSSKKPGIKRKESLRVNTNIETREDAARIQLSGEPVQRTPSNRSHETSPQLNRTTRPSPPLAQQNPIRQTVHPTKAPLTRPMSYHAGGSIQTVPYHNISFSPQMNAPSYHHPVQQQSATYSSQGYQQPHITYVSSLSPTMAMPRQTAYPFEPTIPAQYMSASAGWDPTYQSPFMQSHPSHPPLPRRYSMAGPSPHPVVEYPMIPTRTATRPPVAFRTSASYTPVIADEGIYMNDNESYYRREEEARRKMPPPERPLMRHASTTSAIRKTNRDSIEYVSRPTQSPRKESFGSYKEEVRNPLTSRGSSSKNLPVRVVEAPLSPERPRRSRPQSYHDAVNPEILAERYQAKQRGAVEPQSVNVHDVEKVKKSKSHKSKVSDSGSRSSEGKKTSSTKKRPEFRQKQLSGDGLSLEVMEGCTTTLRRNSKGYVVRVSLNEDTKARNGRSMAREESNDNRRYSASSRRESFSEAIARTIAPRRPSSSHPTARRERIEDSKDEMTKRLTEKYKAIDDTAVEDEDYSEAEQHRKKRSDKYEKLTAQRLQRLKSSESRQSSRSARSANSTKSNRSGTSNKKGIVVEGQPF